MMPDEPVIKFGLAELYSSKGEEQKAITYYESLLAEHKVMVVAIALRLAETLSAIGNWEEAISYYEAGLEEQKDIHSLFDMPLHYTKVKNIREQLVLGKN